MSMLVKDQDALMNVSRYCITFFHDPVISQAGHREFQPYASCLNATQIPTHMPRAWFFIAPYSASGPIEG